MELSFPEQTNGMWHQLLICWDFLHRHPGWRHLVPAGENIKWAPHPYFGTEAASNTQSGATCVSVEKKRHTEAHYLSYSFISPLVVLLITHHLTVLLHLQPHSSSNGTKQHLFLPWLMLIHESSSSPSRQHRPKPSGFAISAGHQQSSFVSWTRFRLSGAREPLRVDNWLTAPVGRPEQISQLNEAVQGKSRLSLCSSVSLHSAPSPKKIKWPSLCKVKKTNLPRTYELAKLLKEGDVSHLASCFKRVLF